MKWAQVDPPKDELHSSEHDTNFPAFAPIVSDAFEHLKGLPPQIEVGSGSFLLEQGSRPTFVYLLRQGLVKLTNIASDGRETMLGLRSAGWYPGGVSALMLTPNLYSVKTLSPCVISRIPAEEFSLRLAQSARMMRHFLATLCNELITQSAEAQAMAEPAEERLAHFMRERNAHNPNFKTVDVLPHLKQMELAQLLAVTPEHLSRLLRKSMATATATEATQIKTNLINSNSAQEGNVLDLIDSTDVSDVIALKAPMTGQLRATLDYSDSCGK
jgi:CRP-like cAMP-binding protein